VRGDRGPNPSSPFPLRCTHGYPSYPLAGVAARPLMFIRGRVTGWPAGPVSAPPFLYGSFARGDATGASDIDLAVVLRGEVSPLDEIDRMIDIVADLNLEHNVLMSVYPVSEDNYSSLNSPILLNLRREGVPV